MRVQATAWADGGASRGGGVLRVALYAVVAVAVLVAAAAALGSLRDTVLLSSPEVREAQARQAIAESNLRTAQLNREATTTRAQGAAEASWEPWTVGAEHLAAVALLGAVPVGLLLALVGAGLMFRRHVSLPTRDGRVPLVGLDRELSAEALLRYQALQGKGATVEALPVGRRAEPVVGSYGAPPSDVWRSLTRPTTRSRSGRTGDRRGEEAGPDRCQGAVPSGGAPGLSAGRTDSSAEGSAGSCA